MTQFNTPVLFLIFNRPDTAQKVFEVIREIKPKYLFIAADGPRKNKPDDIQKCKETRNIVEQIDWDCELKTLFRDENLGCGKAVSSAITWFFDNVEEGIILEDDCLPHLSFFPYCEELLERYRRNDRVMSISGSILYSNVAPSNISYYFSAYTRIWGWATWKSTWQKYIYDVNDIPEKQIEQSLKYCFRNGKIRRFWFWIFYLMRKHKIDTWDYQLFFSILINGGLSTIPRKNMISNIGFKGNATHTFDFNSIAGDLPTFDIGTLIHPSEIKRCINADEYYFIEAKHILSKTSFLNQYIRSQIKAILKLQK
ncbi:MAG: nucleotide-diphospho-sugar transferase [Bacteroidales bacterium]|jgi:hypothetical protein|nr:nucleotide-diphospho-sugar transferase [Bacteroidales bacterium]